MNTPDNFQKNPARAAAEAAGSNAPPPIPGAAAEPVKRPLTQLAEV